MKSSTVSLLAISGLLAVAPMTTTAASAAEPWEGGQGSAQAEDLVRKRVSDSFPNTKIGSVRCGAALAFCEVTAGKNVLYVSRDGRFAMLGTLLDLRDRLNLTEKRVKELGEIEDITSKYGAPGQGSQTPVKAAAASGAAPTIPQTLAVNLPIANAVVHHPGAPLKVKVFSDYNCGYCRMLFSDLKAAPDIEVTEYPLSFLRPDSGDKAKIALCSSDRVSAADALYFGGDVKTGSDCAAASTAVAGNSEFAKQHGISGTPTLVRADGATSAGYMPLEQLRTWLRGAKA